jgi:hypothetical protein
VSNESVLLRVLRGSADSNIRFRDLEVLLITLGFSERIKGSHHIFTRSDVAEILNLQPPWLTCEGISGKAGAESDRSI